MISRFDCPSCGAPLTPVGSAALITCPYCDTQVIVPPQKISDGHIKLQAVEGYIDQIHVQNKSTRDIPTYYAPYGDMIRASKPLNEKMLEKYIDKDVKILLKGSGPAVGETINGKLLSADYQSLVVQSVDGGAVVLQRTEVARITLAKQETGLITKPTLVWKLSAEKSGHHDAQVTYQTDGLTWRADLPVPRRVNQP